MRLKWITFLTKNNADPSKTIADCSRVLISPTCIRNQIAVSSLADANDGCEMMRVDDRGEAGKKFKNPLCGLLVRGLFEKIDFCC
jgi:hypothetical protein